MRKSRKISQAELQVSRILTQAWEAGNWKSIRQFCSEHHVPLAEYTVGRLLAHGDIPRIESALQLGAILCSRDDVIKMLKLLGDQNIYKLMEPDGITTEERRWLLAFHALPEERRVTALKLVEVMAQGE